MRCIAPNLPSILYVPYLYGIEVDDHEVRLHHEYYEIVRPVFLTESYTGSTQWSRLADGTPIEPFECDAETAAQSTSQGA